MNPRLIRATGVLLATTLMLASTSSADDARASSADPGAPATGTAPDPDSTGGGSYDVTITSQDSGEPIAFTIFEPKTIESDATYPLVLAGHGFGAFRSRQPQGIVPIPQNSSPGSVLGDVRHLVDSGFWVVSFDQRGHGQSGGSVRFMDPDHEGRDLVQMLDWLETNLPHLAYHDGNLSLGTVGGSYGGGFQYLLLAIDPDRRLDAMVPQIAWYDLNRSFSPGGVLQSTYVLALLGPAFVSTRARLAPFVLQQMVKAGINNRVGPELEKFLAYHSPRYWCDGRTFSGTTDEGLPFRPATQFPKVDALVVQGIQDVIFTLGEGLDAYECLTKSGGDVRLTSYQFGHTFPNGLSIASPPAFGPGCSLSDLCPTAVRNLPLSGPGLISAVFGCGGETIAALERTWLQAKLQRDPEAVARLSGVDDTCLTLDSLRDSVSLDEAQPRTTRVTIPRSTFTFNGLQPLALPVKLLDVRSPTVIAGVPTARITIKPVLPAPRIKVPQLGIDDPIVYVGLGRSRGSLAGLCRAFGFSGLPALRPICALGGIVPWALPSNLEVIDQQITPVRGLGTHTIELNGIAERLGAGEQLQLLVYSFSPQYALTSSRTPLVPAVKVSGSITLPTWGNLPVNH